MLKPDLEKNITKKLKSTPFHETQDFKLMSTVSALVDIMSQSFVAQSEDTDDYEKCYIKELEYILQYETKEEFSMIAALTAARRIITRFVRAQKERLNFGLAVSPTELCFYKSMSKTPKCMNEKYHRDELLRQRFITFDNLDFE